MDDRLSDLEIRVLAYVESHADGLQIKHPTTSVLGEMATRLVRRGLLSVLEKPGSSPVASITPRGRAFLDAPAEEDAPSTDWGRDLSASLRAGAAPGRSPLDLRCEDCRHVWTGAYLPMEVGRLSQLLRGVHCPTCGATAKRISAGPRQADSATRSPAASAT